MLRGCGVSLKKWVGFFSAPQNVVELFLTLLTHTQVYLNFVLLVLLTNAHFRTMSSLSLSFLQNKKKVKKNESQFWIVRFLAGPQISVTWIAEQRGCALHVKKFKFVSSSEIFSTTNDWYIFHKDYKFIYYNRQLFFL
jgi:hypothetical protein